MTFTTELVGLSFAYCASAIGRALAEDPLAAPMNAQPCSDDDLGRQDPPWTMTIVHPFQIDGIKHAGSRCFLSRRIGERAPCNADYGSNLGPETDFQAPWEVPNLLETGAATMLQIDQTGSYSCLGKSTEN